MSKALLERERWPQERLERFRHERLQQLARHARAHAPFWRERIPSGRVELSDISPTSKSDLADNFDRMITDHRLRLDDLLQHLDGLEGDSLYLDEYRVMTSSGSSGRKAVFV